MFWQKLAKVEKQLWFSPVIKIALHDDFYISRMLCKARTELYFKFFSKKKKKSRREMKWNQIKWNKDKNWMINWEDIFATFITDELGKNQTI